jgi:hypothetical protein
MSHAQLVQELLHSPSWQQELVWQPEFPAWVEAGSVRELSSQLARSDEPYATRSLGTSTWVILFVYAGLAVSAILGAIALHWLFAAS